MLQEPLQTGDYITFIYSSIFSKGVILESIDISDIDDHYTLRPCLVKLFDRSGTSIVFMRDLYTTTSQK